MVQDAHMLLIGDINFGDNQVNALPDLSLGFWWVGLGGIMHLIVFLYWVEGVRNPDVAVGIKWAVGNIDLELRIRWISSGWGQTFEINFINNTSHSKENNVWTTAKDTWHQLPHVVSCLPYLDAVIISQFGVYFQRYPMQLCQHMCCFVKHTTGSRLPTLFLCIFP